ncbi:hypothetical protein EHW12_17505 [Rhodococcus sp. NJ-530]|nr:hypothetical protein EHW12_17505 [Rhodococcus sp. NJ-530]
MPLIRAGRILITSGSLNGGHAKVVDLTVPAARAQRDTLVTRTDVLDKVKVLSLLPDGIHATVEQVATFFEVPAKTISSLVNYNRDEISSDGYRVVRGEELRLNFNPSSLGLDPRTPSLALFNRRVMLRIAMLLRDSEIARRVRTYLLDVEAGVRELDDDEIVFRALKIQSRKIERLTVEVAELEPRAAFADLILDASGDYCVADAAKVLCRAGMKTGEKRLFDELERRGWIFRGRSDGKWRVKQPAIEAGYMSELPQSHKHPKTGARVTDVPQPRVNPKGIQRILDDFRAESQLALDLVP